MTFQIRALYQKSLVRATALSSNIITIVETIFVTSSNTAAVRETRIVFRTENLARESARDSRLRLRKKLYLLPWQPHPKPRSRRVVRFVSHLWTPDPVTTTLPLIITILARTCVRLSYTVAAKETPIDSKRRNNANVSAANSAGKVRKRTTKRVSSILWIFLKTKEDLFVINPYEFQTYAIYRWIRVLAEASSPNTFTIKTFVLVGNSFMVGATVTQTGSVLSRNASRFAFISRNLLQLETTPFSLI